MSEPIDETVESTLDAPSPVATPPDTPASPEPRPPESTLDTQELERFEVREAATVLERLSRRLDTFNPFEALRIMELSSEDGPAVVRGAVTRRHAATAIGRNPATGEAEVSFVGLLGPMGVLPPHYTDAAIQARRGRNHAFAAFFDVFVTRLTALFTRAAEKYQLPALVARHGPSGADAVTAALFSTIGIGLPALRGRFAAPDHRLLPYAGLLSRDVRSAAGLEVMLAHHLEAPVTIKSFQRRWLPIAPEEQTRMSSAAPQFCRLGVDAVAGAGIWDVSSTFRIVIGPVGYEDFRSLAPGGKRIAELAEIVRFYMNPDMEFDVQVVLRKDEVPEALLSGDTPPVLGWNMWARQMPLEHDADQSIFTPP